MHKAHHDEDLLCSVTNALLDLAVLGVVNNAVLQGGLAELFVDAVQQLLLATPQLDVAAFLAAGDDHEQVWDGCMAGCVHEGHHGLQPDVVMSHQAAWLCGGYAKSILVQLNLQDMAMGHLMCVVLSAWYSCICMEGAAYCPSRCASAIPSCRNHAWQCSNILQHCLVKQGLAHSRE